MKIKGINHMLFRSRGFIVGLFDNFPIGTRLGIGTDSSFWVGRFGGIRDGVAILTNAQLFANIGKPVDGTRPVVRIPICQITFVSE
jgi:hypothetical protein